MNMKERKTRNMIYCNELYCIKCGKKLVSPKDDYKCLICYYCRNVLSKDFFKKKIIDDTDLFIEPLMRK